MMDENNTDAIYEFGKDVVIKARDYTIDNIEMLFQGKSKSKRGKIFQTIEDISQEKLDIFKCLILDFVDDAIHNFFVKFDESCGKYKIITKDNNGNDFDIVTESDGLPYGYLEFIDEFSKYKTADEILATGQVEK